MKKTGTRRESSKNKRRPADPLKNKSDIQKNPDVHIDQDFPGYPHNPSREKIVHPTTAIEKATANLPDIRTGEENKTTSPGIKKTHKRKTLQTEEQYSDGSANAFEATEGIDVEEKDDSLNNKKRKNRSNY